MKKVLLILFLVLSLLVSCATTKDKAPQAENEVPQTKAVAPEISAQEEEKSSDESEIVVPQEESAPETEPDIEDQPVVEQVIAEEETPVEDVVEEEAPVEDVVEEETPVEEVTEEETPVEEVAVDSDPVADEQDWSQLISAVPDEAIEEQTAPQSEPTEEVAPAEEENTETPAEEPSEEPAEEQSQPETDTRNTSGFVDKLTAFIKKVGNFVANQILLSIGIFVCFGGMIYLIVALIISSRRNRKQARSKGKKTRTIDEKSEDFHSSADTDPETDEDFLKRLLGDGNE